MSSISVRITTASGEEIPADLALVTKHLQIVKEIPGFGPDDEPSEDDMLPLAVSKKVIVRVLEFATSYDGSEFTLESVSQGSCGARISVSPLVRLRPAARRAAHLLR